MAFDRFLGLQAGEREAIQKGMKVYLPTVDGYVEQDLDEVERQLDADSGQPTIATREAVYSPGSFTSGDALGRPVLDAPKPQETYGFQEYSEVVRVGPFAVLTPQASGGAPENANYVPTEPADRPTGPVVDEEMRDDEFSAIRKAVGWANLIQPTPSPDQFGAMPGQDAAPKRDRR